MKIAGDCPASSWTRIVHILIILLYFSFISEAILHPVDFLALQSIRKSLNDFQGSTFFSTWDFTSDPPNNFTSVLCRSDRVISLNLGDPRAGYPGLKGRLHSALSKLSSLTQLTLIPGRVVGALPDALSQCTNLRILALSRNCLSDPIPHSFGHFKSLQTLDLSDNLLAGDIPVHSGRYYP